MISNFMQNISELLLSKLPELARIETKQVAIDTITEFPLLSMYPGSFTTELPWDKLKGTQKEENVFRLEEMEQLFFIELWTKEPTFAEKWSVLVLGLLMAEKDNLLGLSNQSEGRFHKTELLTTEFQTRALQFLKGTFGQDQDLFSVRLNFKLSGRLVFHDLKTEGIEKIQEIDYDISTDND